MMKTRTLLGAGTALAMLMTAPALAVPAGGGFARQPAANAMAAPVLLAQAGADDLRRRLSEEELTPEERSAIESQIRAIEAAPPAPEPAPAEPAAPEQPAPEPQPSEPAPAAPEQPQPEQPQPAQPEQPPAVEEPAQQPPVEAPPPQEAPREASPPEPAPVQQPAEQPAPEQPQPAPAPQQPAAEEPAPPAEAPVPQEAPSGEEAPTQAPAEPPVPSPAPEQPQPTQPAPEQPAAEQPAPEAPAEAPVPQEAPPSAEQPAEPPVPSPAPEQQPAPAQPEAPQPAPAEQAPPAAQEPAPAPAEGAAAPVTPPAPVVADPAQDPEGVLPEGAAAVLDSAKENAVQPAGAAATQQPAAPEQPAAPPPATDAEAQAAARPAQIESATAEAGQRIDAAEVDRRRQERQNREGEQFVRELGGRLLFELGRQMIVRSDDRDRIGRGSSDVYYEDLPGGWTRETVVRDNGSQVVTIRDRYGDVIRRSRITSDGREYVLVYAGNRERGGDRPREWRDPGLDMPPLRLNIPVSQYVLDARRARDADDYYRFLDQPPVEPVRRLYSVDEVKYSARVRDSVRRIDLDTLTFGFGSASIEESEVGRLQTVADAMERMLEKNPAETFLIEGHTDAVGTDGANLALSDRRAETVASALTDMFGIPPENLVTQGYGERYLKVATQEPSRDNRRVAIRRITPLVAPVASAN